MWVLPLLIVGLAVVLSVPLGRYMAKVLDRAGPRNAFERLLDTGPQSWKQYCLAMLAHPLLILVPTGLFAVMAWGAGADRLAAWAAANSTLAAEWVKSGDDTKQEGGNGVV